MPAFYSFEPIVGKGVFLSDMMLLLFIGLAVNADFVFVDFSTERLEEIDKIHFR
jgi:hypothetical protein